MKKYLLVTSLILSGVNISLYAQDNNVPYDIVKQTAELAKANELTKLPPVITTNPQTTNKTVSANSVDSVIMMLEGLKQNTRKTTLTYEEYMKAKEAIRKDVDSKVKFYESK